LFEGIDLENETLKRVKEELDNYIGRIVPETDSNLLDVSSESSYDKLAFKSELRYKNVHNDPDLDLLVYNRRRKNGRSKE